MLASQSFLPYGRQTISEDDIAAVVEVLRSPYLTQGPAVPAFEQAVATKVNARYGVAANSATSALHLACLALGLGPGDRLWTSPITFVASANCGRYCGANVDFVDIDSATGLMCIEALSGKLAQAERDGCLPKVLVPVHLCGTSCNMEAIGALAQQYGFSVLEDASHAIGGCYQAQPVGCCRYSSITVFSFHPVKIITTGEGGMAMTNDPLLARRMRELRTHGITKDLQHFELPSPGPWSYEQQDLGFNYRMSDIQAALGFNQIKKLDDVVLERNRLFKQYSKMLDSLAIDFLEIPQDVKSSMHLAVIRLKDRRREHHRYVFEMLRKNNIGVQVHYTPVHLQPYYRKMGFTEGSFPESEDYSINALSIPLYPGLTDSDQKRVSQLLASIL